MITIEFSSTITNYNRILITYCDTTTTEMSYMYVDFKTLCILLQNFGYIKYSTSLLFDYHGVKIYAPLKIDNQKHL